MSTLLREKNSHRSQSLQPVRNLRQQTLPCISQHYHQLPTLPCKAIWNSPLTCSEVLGQHPKHSSEWWSHTPPPLHQPILVATLPPQMKKDRILHTPNEGHVTSVLIWWAPLPSLWCGCSHILSSIMHQSVSLSGVLPSIFGSICMGGFFHSFLLYMCLLHIISRFLLWS